MDSAKKSRMRVAMAMLVCAWAVFAGVVGAQTVTTGGITGVVRDAQGGVLPGATVTVTSADTGLTRSAVTEQDGTFLVTLLPPGRYTVDAELTGFGKASVPNVDVLLGTATRADVAINPRLTE